MASERSLDLDFKICERVGLRNAYQRSRPHFHEVSDFFKGLCLKTTASSLAADFPPKLRGTELRTIYRVHIGRIPPITIPWLICEWMRCRDGGVLCHTKYYLLGRCARDAPIACGVGRLGKKHQY